VVEDDIEVFFEQQNDPEAIQMAVWPARGREAFFEHWHGILHDDSLVAKTILSGEDVAGNIGSFERDGKRYVGYWLGREYWGQGLATKALAELVAELERRCTRRSRPRTSAPFESWKSAGSRSSAQ
jgi:RimJ/RimL family protein N-acetyltransferase